MEVGDGGFIIAKNEVGRWEFEHNSNTPSRKTKIVGFQLRAVVTEKKPVCNDREYICRWRAA